MLTDHTFSAPISCRWTFMFTLTQSQSWRTSPVWRPVGTWGSPPPSSSAAGPSHPWQRCNVGLFYLCTDRRHRVKPCTSTNRQTDQFYCTLQKKHRNNYIRYRTAPQEGPFEAEKNRRTSSHCQNCRLHLATDDMFSFLLHCSWLPVPTLARMQKFGNSMTTPIFNPFFD